MCICDSIPGMRNEIFSKNKTNPDNKKLEFYYKRTHKKLQRQNKNQIQLNFIGNTSNQSMFGKHNTKLSLLLRKSMFSHPLPWLFSFPFRTFQDLNLWLCIIYTKRKHVAFYGIFQEQTIN